ncbi:reverse transcriptase domain-containing protein [Tanacetum coccineum]
MYLPPLPSTVSTELIYPPAFFDIMIHLVIHLPLEALKGGPIRPRWMFPFERYMKKLKGYVRNNAKPEVNFLNKDMKKEFPTTIRQRHVDNDPRVSATSELFALACGPTPTPISVNSCVVNGVRFVVHNHDERHTTQNSGICSPGGKDREMYYDMARRQPHWKVVEHVNHKKFSDGGVIVVEEDPDVIHFDNSSDLPLSTSLNDLDNATLHIDGQSMEVDAPPNIIDLDEDDDIIDDEDALPHDLADFDDEDLVNVDDDDGVDVVYSSEEED